MTKIEVIVPVYNNEQYIERCLQSLLDQSYADLKIIVVNDGSTDKSAEIIEKISLANPGKVRYFYKENQGIATARNFGLEHVEAEYFGFLDSDDYVESTMYQKMYEQIQQEDSDLCMCDFYWEYPNQLKVAKDGPYHHKHEIMANMFATLWNKLYKTSWVRETKLTFPDGLHYEDASFLYRLAIHMHHVAYVNEPLVHYVQRPGSITHTYQINIQDMMDVFRGIRAYYLEENKYDKYFPEIEYLFIRFFLGNSYLRACRIVDHKLRRETLCKAWSFLHHYFPNWKNNQYLCYSGKKNFYFKHLNKGLYFFNSHVFKLLYRLKIMK